MMRQCVLVLPRASNTSGLGYDAALPPPALPPPMVVTQRRLRFWAVRVALSSGDVQGRRAQSMPGVCLQAASGGGGSVRR